MREQDAPSPIAPASIASATSAFISASSSAVASARSDAASPMTAVRITECPASTATFAHGAAARSAAMYPANVSNPQRTPARSASRSMPSTTERLRRMRSRTGGGAGAIPNPQLPMTTVVTPSDGEGDRVRSQVIWAS